MSTEKKSIALIDHNACNLKKIDRKISLGASTFFINTMDNNKSISAAQTFDQQLKKKDDIFDRLIRF